MQRQMSVRDMDRFATNLDYKSKNQKKWYFVNFRFDEFMNVCKLYVIIYMCPILS